MPTPAKTSREELVRIALGLVDSGGLDAVTIAAVAAAAGVKGPSLYKHFADRDALVTEVELVVLRELDAELRRNTQGNTPRARVRALGHAYRRFALDAPHRYGLIYRPRVNRPPEIDAALRSAAMPLLEELAAANLPEVRALQLARTFVAFIHGFVSMEIAGAFRLGGDIDEAFASGIETISATLP